MREMPLLCVLTGLVRQVVDELLRCWRRVGSAAEPRPSCRFSTRTGGAEENGRREDAVAATDLLQKTVAVDVDLDERDPRQTRWHPSERATEANRLQKTLEGANIKLGDVASNILGQSARQMLEGLVAGADPVKARLVELRFFTGLRLEEAAQVLGVSEPTAKRHWNYARAWLFQEIERLR